MEPSRFDDVEFRVIEQPEPAPRRRGPRRYGHVTLAVIGALCLGGSLAAGASALTSTANAPTRTAPAYAHDGKPCMAGAGHGAVAPRD